VSDKMLAIYNAFVTWGTNLSAWWSGLWTGIYNALESVFSKIETVINSILSAVSKVTGAVSSVVGAVGGAVGGTIGGAIKAFASGGIVNSPTLALIGEAGPEAVIPLSAFNGGSSLGTGGGSGSGGNIQIFIQGGYYLDQSAAQQIGNALATSIGRQLKLKNYA
jgi:phage-related minor tail protein